MGQFVGGDMNHLLDIFATVSDASAAHGLPVLVIGGHAINAYGYVRTTLDVDFLVCVDDFPGWRQLFESFGYRWQEQTEAFAKFIPSDNEVLAFPVDIMLVSRKTFAKLSQDQHILNFGSTQLPVPQPLYLIALKLHAMKNDERRKLGKDLPDILQLIRICGIATDSLEFQNILDRYANQQTRALVSAALDMQG